MASVIHRIIDNQIRTWEAAAERRRAEEREEAERLPTIRPCITMGRMIGSGGGEIAQQLSTRLGWQVFDREIVEVIVRQGHFREAIMKTLDEHDRSSVELWVDGLIHGTLVDKEDYHRILVRVLTSISVHGHAIILGRGGTFVLDPRRTLNVRIVAPRAVRIEAVARSRAIPASRAAEFVEETDRERAAFILKYFHRPIDDPTAYDLTIDTGGLSREAATELIDTALHLKLGALPNVQF
jgi:cytidylate kinase